MAKELKDVDAEGNIYLMLSEYFRQTDEFEKASKYLKNSIGCFNSSKNFPQMTHAKTIFAEAQGN